MGRKQEIFESVLTDAYDHNKFVDFSREIITGLNLKRYDIENKPYNTFSNFIASYFQIGDFTDPEDNTVGIFSVELKRGESVERARTAQRTFVKRLLENGSYSAALVAFYSLDSDKWRFSFVRMDYEFAKGKIKESLTPARRYSYLVGKGEPCHTAMDRLLPIFMDDSKNPTIDEIEESFSVEKVTKDFFEAYKEKYLQLADYLNNNEDFVRESNIKHFTTEQFTKKLLSQIVFLYFIQKKGWLGVSAIPKTLSEREYKNAFFSHGSMSRELVGKVYYQDGEVYRRNAAVLKSLSDEEETEFAKCVKGEPWGSGPKDFMRRIFENAVKHDQNFFDDCLEPLFYTGLNQDRGDNAFFPPLHCRIPFLNGGLFEELEHYEWRYNDFDIPNEIFSNIDTKGREADGILDIFDRYNFTMAEDEPLEKEVAVDPEMLGKVFENLLEVRDRKSKGAFYTPREIVHYMCSESLINYLTTNSGIPEDDIRKFITLGEFFKDDDARRTVPVDNKTGEVVKDLYTKGYHYEFDYNKQLEMPTTILDYKSNVNRIDELDRLLADVRVVDPAVGSGAFPLGLLNEIVKARDTLTTYMAIPMSDFKRKMLYVTRSPYQLKTETIKNCIFACDIEPSAADITKLRLWLSLVIEDEIGEKENDEFGEHTKPRKLPNLDCNVLCGNSLISSFKGVDLICNTEAIGNQIAGTNRSINDIAIESHINGLIELQNQLYNAETSTQKEEIKKRIQVLYDAIIVEQLQVNPDAVDSYIDSRNAGSKPFILWQLYFPKVFKDKGGFDICIMNPPYISTKDRSEDEKNALNQNYGFADDLYSHFIFKGMKLVRNSGVVTAITPDTYFTTITKANLRKLMLDNTFCSLAHLGHDVFDSAMVSTAICIVQKKESNNETFTVIDAKGCRSLKHALTYQCNPLKFKTSINRAFFVPNEENTRINEKFSDIHNTLVEQYWEKIVTSAKAEKNKEELDNYRESLQPGDWTIIGLITEGGQGLATANNGRFVGVGMNTKQAETIRTTRIEKLLEFNKLNRTNYNMPENEEDIWDLFESIKNQYGLKAFGQGYVYKIVPDDKVADIEALTDEEKRNGISGERTFVRYDKGDKDGNRWYYETPFLIDWSKDNVSFLRENSGKKGKGMPVLRNPQFNFKEGFCWNNNLNENYIDIKCKLKEKSVSDVASMSLYPLTEKVPAFWIVLTINNTISGTIYRRFLNATVNVQMNDIKALPIIVPNIEQLEKGKELFEEAVEIQKQFCSNSIEDTERSIKLAAIQERIEAFMTDVYGL